MSEQQAPPVDTPDHADTPDSGTGTQDQPDWESRYKEAQAWGTQNAQRAAELERYEQAVEALRSEDPQAREWAAQVFGIELITEEEPDDDEFVDPTEELRRDLAEMKAWRQQLSAQEQQAELEHRDLDVIGTALNEFKQKIGRDLTQKEIGLLGDSAWANRDEQGLPNIVSVLEAYEEVLASQAPKPRPKAPHFSSVSQAGTQTAAPANHAERVEAAMEKLTANEQ